MAKRRMFSQDVVGTDKFFAQPADSQLVYMYLCMWADDDGFTDHTDILLSTLELGRETLEPLMKNGYLHGFDNGVYVILHWPMINKVKKDRYAHTVHKEKYAQLTLSPTGAYILKNPANKTIV